MADAPYFLVPLTDDLGEDAWPRDVLASAGDQGSVFDLIYRAQLTITGDENYLAIDAILFVVGELVLPLLPADAIALVVGSAGDDPGSIAFRLTLGRAPDHRPSDDDTLVAMERGGAPEMGVPAPPNPFDGPQPDLDEHPGLSAGGRPLPWRAQILIDLLSLRFSRELFIPVDIDPDTGEVTEKEGHVHVGLGLGFVVDGDGNFVFGVGTIDGEDEGDPPPSPTALHFSDSFQLGDSHVVVTVGELYLRFSPETPPPAWAPADQGPGVYLSELTVRLPPDLSVGLLENIGARNVVIATGGFSGNLEAAWTQELLEAADGERPRFVDGPGAGDLFGMPFALSRLDLEVRQSNFARASLACDLVPPIFDKPLGLVLAIDAAGGFTAEVKASALLPEEADDALVRLRQEGLLELVVSGARFELADGVGTFSLAGSLTPLVSGIDWPTLQVQKLSIDTRGEVDLEGGWIDLPESFTLDFHAFKVELDQIGFGSEGENAEQRQWVGLSGGIRLIEGIPLSASVEGLKVSWRPRLSPGPHDPDIRVSLEGIAVHLEIPGTLVLDGAVRYREIDRPPATRPPAEEGAESAAAAGVFGHVFTGSITVELTALNTEIAGELLIGDLTSYRYDDAGDLEIVQSFTALYIVMAVELPSAIPLGATGTGLYGLKGLFGMHVAPDRHLDAEGDPESWYAWYKADRGNESAYSVTKVAKWAPRFDNYAFGAGITLGTVYDDGFTINAGLLAAILIPGPVVMIEGRANLIKPRGGQGGEGALYALIVFDGIAETFAMNVDINFTLEDVITVGGGLEAFFDFNDGDRWYIYIGRKEPLEKRIRAEVISIISASAYFMVDSHGILFGAAAGLDLQASYGPVELKLILRISFEIGVFWKEPQLTGMVELYGEISIKIFGIGIGIVLQALLEGSAPQPWWIHGLARVALNLPFPLPSFDASVEFTWGQGGSPALVELIKSAAMVHGRLPGVSWALPDASTPESDWPVIPVDAIPALSLGKPISGVSLEADGTDWFRSEDTEGVELGYELRDVVLEEQDATGWVVRWSRPQPRYADLRLRPDPHAREPQVELWWYAPLDTLDSTSRRNYVDPCPGSITAQRHCVDWHEVAEGVVSPPVFRRGGLTFVVGFHQQAVVRKSVVPPPPGVPDRGLLIQNLVVRFPEPVAWVEIRWADRDARFDLFLDGSPVAEAPLAAGARSYQPLAGAPSRTLDTVHLGAVQGNNAQPVLVSICWITQRELAASAGRGGDGDRTALRSELILEPHRSYRLRATGVRIERAVGEEGPGREATQRVAWGFRTGGLPGTDYAALPPGITTPRPDFADGPLNQVATYVARSVPAAGTPLFYRGYDVLIELKDPYAAAMLSPAVAVRVLDRNGAALASTAAFTLTGPFPFVTPGLLALLGAPREAACATAPLPWTRQLLGRYIACRLPDATRPRRMVRVELLAQPPYGTQPVFGFEFATSAFRDIVDHLGAGLDNAAADPTGTWRGVRRVRTLGAGTTVGMSWLAGLQARLARQATMRRALAAALTVGEHDAGTTIVDATAELAALAADLGEVYRGLYEVVDRGGTYSVPATPTAALPAVGATPAITVSLPGVHDRFVASGLGDRPLPGRHVECLAIDAPGGWYLLIESPEPLDRARLSIERADLGTPLPLVWSGDGTRAFVFSDAPDGLFGSSPPPLRWRFLRGGLTAPDLDPLYRGGELSDAEALIWDLART